MVFESSNIYMCDRLFSLPTDMFNDKVFDGRRIEVRYDRASHPK